MNPQCKALRPPPWVSTVLLGGLSFFAAVFSVSLPLSLSSLLLSICYLIPRCEETDLSLLDVHKFARLGLDASEVVRRLAVHEHRRVVALQSDVPSSAINVSQSTQQHLSLILAL